MISFQQAGARLDDRLANVAGRPVGRATKGLGRIVVLVAGTLVFAFVLGVFGAMAGVFLQLSLHAVGLVRSPSQTNGSDWWVIGGAIFMVVYAGVWLVYLEVRERLVDRRYEREVAAHNGSSA
jgi:uncharacterized BrkB/YihY/UPF0761 family membrane protein